MHTYVCIYSSLQSPNCVANHLITSQTNKIIFKGHQLKVLSRKCSLAVLNDCSVFHLLCIWCNGFFFFLEQTQKVTFVLELLDVDLSKYQLQGLRQQTYGKFFLVPPCGVTERQPQFLPNFETLQCLERLNCSGKRVMCLFLSLRWSLFVSILSIGKIFMEIRKSQQERLQIVTKFCLF